jgi:hypothetical protein
MAPDDERNLGLTCPGPAEANRRTFHAAEIGRVDEAHDSWQSLHKTPSEAADPA